MSNYNDSIKYLLDLPLNSPLKRLLKRELISCYDEFISLLHEDIEQQISQFEHNPQYYTSDSEDEMTAHIIRGLVLLGYTATHDAMNGGHADILVEDNKNNYTWLAEAKIYNGPKSIYKGYLQLTTRYTTGRLNENSSAILIYIHEKNKKSILGKWQDYLTNKKGEAIQVKNTFIDGTFVTSEEHDRSGIEQTIKHFGVSLHFDPQDR